MREERLRLAGVSTREYTIEDSMLWASGSVEARVYDRECSRMTRTCNSSEIQSHRHRRLAAELARDTEANDDRTKANLMRELISQQLLSRDKVRRAVQVPRGAGVFFLHVF